VSRIRLYVNDEGRCVLHTGGFSWLAGFLPAIWAFRRRLFGVALLSLVYSTVVNLLILSQGAGVQSLVVVVQVAVFGALANRLHEALLERRGWRVTAEESPGPGAPSEATRP